MAYTISDNKKWIDKRFRKLDTNEKLLYMYLWDVCDDAGFYKLDDIERDCFLMGIKEEDFERALKGLCTPKEGVDNNLKRGFIVVDGWLWIEHYLQHNQRDFGTTKNNAHKPIYKILELHLDRFNDEIEFKKFLQKITPWEGVWKGPCNGNGMGNGSNNFFRKSENLFFGPVPDDIIQLSKRLPRAATAAQWHDLVETELRKLGYATEREIPTPIDEENKGRIDLVASKPGVVVGIELDCRVPRSKSIQKVKHYPAGAVLLRDPKIINVEPVVDDEIYTRARPIAKYFNVSEKRQTRVFRKILDFVQHMLEVDDIEYFDQQFEYYRKHKDDSGEKRHGLESFLGIHESGFQPGAWNAKDWKNEYERNQQAMEKQKYPNKLVAAVWQRLDGKGQTEYRNHLESLGWKLINSPGGSHWKKPDGTRIWL